MGLPCELPCILVLILIIVCMREKRSEILTQRDASFSRRSFLKSAMVAGAALLSNPLFGADSDTPFLPKLKGNRFLTFNTVVRVNQIEVSRDRNAGEDEGNLHTLESVRKLRECFERGFPGGRMTWAFSWLALQDQRPNYQAIRKQVLEYHHSYGDEMTFIPGGYFAPMYNRREQVNRDLHDAGGVTTPEACRAAADFMIKEVRE